MTDYSNTEQGNCAFVRDLLRQNQPSAWARIENWVIAQEQWQPLDPPKPRFFAPARSINFEDDDYDEQEWMNEVRTARYEQTGI